MESYAEPKAADVAPRWRQRLIAVGAAVVATFVIWLIAVPVAGVELQATSGPNSTELEPVTLGAVFTASLVASLAGWGFLAVLERFTTRARTIWTIVALIVLLVSFGGPLLGAGIPVGSRITLAAMHTAVAATLIPLFRRSSVAR